MFLFFQLQMYIAVISKLNDWIFFNEFSTYYLKNISIHYILNVIKFVSDLQQVGGFLCVL